MTGVSSLNLASLVSKMCFIAQHWGCECHKLYVFHRKVKMANILHLWWKENCLVFCQKELGIDWYTSAAPHFPTYIWSCRGALVLWNGWHSAPKISLPWYEFALSFRLASFTTQCAQLGWLDCKTPSFVSTSTMRHNRIHLCGSYTLYKQLLCQSSLGLWPLLSNAVRWPRRTTNCEPYQLKPR